MTSLFEDFPSSHVILDLTAWNVSSVRIMTCMFRRCRTRVLIDSWVDGKREGANSGDGEAGRTLTEELPLARKSCKFAFLNGAAPVCYGVPVELSEQP